MLWEMDCGYRDIDALCESMEFYRENRDICPNHDSYYSELIKSLMSHHKGSNENIVMKK